MRQLLVRTDAEFPGRIPLHAALSGAFALQPLRNDMADPYLVISLGELLAAEKSWFRPSVFSLVERVGLLMKADTWAFSAEESTWWSVLRSPSTFSRVLASLESAATYAEEAYLPGS